MADHIKALENTVNALEAAYDRVREDLLRNTGYDADVFPPEAMQDTNGRYILLDALTAIVGARTVLASASSTAADPRDGEEQPTIA